MRTKILSMSATLAAALAPGLSAQACLGLPAFTDASVHVNVAAEFPDSARSYAAGIGAGVENGVFLNLGGGVVTYQGLDERALLGFAELGFQIPLARAQLCPIAGGFFGTGPDLPEFGLKVTTYGGSAGIALGIPLDLPVLDAIPHAAVKYDYFSQTADQEDVGSTTETSRSGRVDLGLGLVFDNRFTVQPLVHVPFANDQAAEVTFGVFASLILPIPVPGFGR
jgi:hypothetical protein